MSLDASHCGFGDRLTPRYGPELRVLIVGGGVTGLTLAALLEQRGFSPTVVERRIGYDHADCVLGLWPAGSRVLKGIGLFRAFLNIGLECARYTVANTAGAVLHSYSLEPLAERYGPLVNVFRPDLIALLQGAIASNRLRLGVKLRDIAETSAGVVALFDDGTNDTFDLIVACDGLRSGIRRLAFGEDPRPQAGMMGWGISCPVSFVPPREITEYWGERKFFGIYPARDRLYAFAGVRADVPSSGPRSDHADWRIARLRGEFQQFGGLVPWVLGQLEEDRVFHRDYFGLRMDTWHRGRVVLVGHAAHAVLGTGGLGTSLAMESAAVFADELCRADSSRIALAFEQYTARRRARVDHVLSWSRRLGRFMFTGNRFVARLRDGAVHLTADERLLVGVERVLSEPL